MGRKKWTEEEEVILARYYPNEHTSITAQRIGRTVVQTYQHANTKGLYKSDAYKETLAKESAQQLIKCGAKSRFQKGSTPATKGKRQCDYMSAEGIAATSKTRFKKGDIPKRVRPVGAERVSKDGYVEVKVAEPRKWAAKHRVEWEKVNGPLPANMILVCRSNDKLNTSPDNWCLISRGEHMKKNSLHNYDPEVVKTIQLIGALNRQINKKNNEKKHH